MKSVLLAIIALGLTSLPAWGANHVTVNAHTAKGLACTVCHPKPDVMPDTATCSGCHPKDQLAEKTAGVKPHNPHISPHYGKDLDCVNCHVGHEASVNFCVQCHNFSFEVK